MNMTMQDVLAVLGAKELELVSLRTELAKLQEEQKKTEKKDEQQHS